MKRARFQFLSAWLVVILISAISSAQDDRLSFDKSKVPASANSTKDFVPAGWKVEEEISGDLNGDGIADYALKLVQDLPATDKDGMATERDRVLAILFGSQNGKLSRAAVNDKLLQCTRCGGAFYGVVESPANVKIEKGVLIVEQDHGSRNITDTTYRFRYEIESGKFLLIGFDLADADRLSAQTVTESTNYLTGIRVATRSKGKRDITTRSPIAKTKIYFEGVDGDKLETAAYQRLKL